MTQQRDTTDDDQLAELEASAAEAEQRAAELRSAIVAGDESVSTTELIEVEAEVAKRRSVVEVTRDLLTQRNERRAEAERIDQLERYEALLREHGGTGDADLLADLDALRTLAERIVAKNERRSAGIHEVYNGLQRLGAPPRFELQSGGVRFVDDDVTITPVDSEELVADAVVRALVSAGVEYGGLMNVAKSRHPEEVIADAFGLTTGDVFGHSDRLRRTARIVAERDTTTGAN